MEPALRNKDYTKTQPYVAGWGATSFSKRLIFQNRNYKIAIDFFCIPIDGPSSGTLREVQIPVVSQASCKESYKGFRTVNVDDSVLCAGLARGGKDACQVNIKNKLSSNQQLP